MSQMRSRALWRRKQAWRKEIQGRIRPFWWRKKINLPWRANLSRADRLNSWFVLFLFILINMKWITHHQKDHSKSCLGLRLFDLFLLGILSIDFCIVSSYLELFSFLAHFFDSLQELLGFFYCFLETEMRIILPCSHFFDFLWIPILRIQFLLILALFCSCELFYSLFRWFLLILAGHLTNIIKVWLSK